MKTAPEHLTEPRKNRLSGTRMDGRHTLLARVCRFISGDWWLLEEKGGWFGVWHPWRRHWWWNYRFDTVAEAKKEAARRNSGWTYEICADCGCTIESHGPREKGRGCPGGGSSWTSAEEKRGRIAPETKERERREPEPERIECHYQSRDIHVADLHNRFFAWEGRDIWHADRQVQVRLEEDGTVYLSTESGKNNGTFKSATVTFRELHAIIQAAIDAHASRTDPGRESLIKVINGLTGAAGT